MAQTILTFHMLSDKEKETIRLNYQHLTTDETTLASSNQDVEATPVSSDAGSSTQDAEVTPASSDAGSSKQDNEVTSVSSDAAESSKFNDSSNGTWIPKRQRPYPPCLEVNFPCSQDMKDLVTLVNRMMTSNNTDKIHMFAEEIMDIANSNGFEELVELCYDFANGDTTRSEILEAITAELQRERERQLTDAISKLAKQLAVSISDISQQFNVSKEHIAEIAESFIRG